MTQCCSADRDLKSFEEEKHPTTRGSYLLFISKIQPHIAHHRKEQLGKMKVAIATLAIVLAASSVSAFAPAPAFTRGVSTQLFGGDDEEEEGLDLNLEEMFDM